MNVVVYLVAVAAGAMMRDVVVNGQMPITLSMVATMSVLGAFAATLVYAFVGRFAWRPVRVFRIVAALALLFSFGGPFSIAGAPAAMIATLLLTHVIAATVIVSLVTTMGRPEARVKEGRPLARFSDAELGYLLGERRLGRLATADATSLPHVVPVGWRYNQDLGTIDVSGRDLAVTKSRL